MTKTKGLANKDNALHVGRAVLAIFALLVAAGHLAYTSGMGTASFMRTAVPSNTLPGSGVPSAGFGAMTFNAMGFWFDVEIIAYSIIAVVFLLGLRTWYLPAMVFNAFNLGIYFLSGLVAIPGITFGAMPGRFVFMPGLSAINIIVVGWVVLLVLGILALKYDPGSELDRLLVTRRSGHGAEK